MFKISFDFRMSIRRHGATDTPTETLPRAATAATPAAAMPLADFAAQETRRMGGSRSISTRHNYHTAVASFVSFAGSGVTLADITADLIEAYQSWLRSRGICLNTVSCYMRSLRTIYNRAADQDLVPRMSPFRHVFTGKALTGKRSVDTDSIRRLLALRLKPGSTLELARDLFLFSFYAMGMPFVDMAFLRKSQIDNGHILYHRRKTGQRVSVAIEPCMADIICRHAGHSGQYVFPILRSAEADEAAREYATRLTGYNRALKRLAAMAGMDRPLTSYVARHTWATAAFMSDIDLDVISKAMGHANPRTTLIYIRDTDTTRIERANRRVIETVSGDEDP